jgi:hypothetical protein
LRYLYTDLSLIPRYLLIVWMCRGFSLSNSISLITRIIRC